VAIHSLQAKRSNQTTRSVPKLQILNMFIIQNADITSLRANEIGVAIQRTFKLLSRLQLAIPPLTSLRGRSEATDVAIQHLVIADLSAITLNKITYP
jgi:hypothetical protein